MTDAMISPTTSTDADAPATATAPADTLRFPELSLRITPLDDPVLVRLGHHPRSEYVERFWLCILGPSALLFVRRIAAGLDASPDGFELDMVAFARELGLGTKGGRHSPLWRTLDRLCRFGLASRNGAHVTFSRRMPPLTQRQVERLPVHLQRAHRSLPDPTAA